MSEEIKVNFKAPAYVGLCGVWRFASESQPGVWHTACVGLDGVLFCSCPGFQYREACWHVEYLGEKGPEDIRGTFSQD